MNAIASAAAGTADVPADLSAATPDAADPAHPVHAYARLMDRIDTAPVRDAARRGRQAVEHHPFRTAALAAAAGLALGLLVGRR